MIPCPLCEHADHEECGCWTLVYELAQTDEEMAYIERGLLNPTEH
jgi:hypothetical protein